MDSAEGDGGAPSPAPGPPEPEEEEGMKEECEHCDWPVFLTHFSSGLLTTTFVYHINMHSLVSA